MSKPPRHIPSPTRKNLLDFIREWTNHVGTRELFRAVNLTGPARAGLALLTATALALLCANTAAQAVYIAFLDLPFGMRLGDLALEKPVLLWINDGLMAVFFLVVGLEIKREVMSGHLSDLRRATLPIIAAIGGMGAPAAIYAALNYGSPETLVGWAIPSATDIAFAIGVLSLLGNRVPASLKVFLLALAIIDDLGAIIIIAIFYTADLSALSLALAGMALVVLLLFNLAGVRSLAAYILVGTFLWVCVLKSGVHATLAGVALAMAIPLQTSEGTTPMLVRLEHALQPWVAFAIMPLFAFANAGVSLSGMGGNALLAPVPLGILSGLFIGKQAGVMAASWAAVRSGLAVLPDGANWWQFYGVAILTGIGFTMSLFIGTLAFENAGYHAEVRLGVLAGTALSTLAGLAVLVASRRAQHQP